MTELIRTLRTGIVGLDLALGGGVRLVRRTAEKSQESASVLIRGGPGTGKSILAQELALRVAERLGGDVVYVCVEVLPSEVRAQRMGFDGYDNSRVVDLSQTDARRAEGERTKPSLVIGMQEINESSPDLGQTMLDLATLATERGYRPTVIVVDSLIDGYHLGRTMPRAEMDGICKLAAHQGWVLVLVEENGDSAVTEWAFVVDTAVELRVVADKTGDQQARQLVVRKHRFGPCEPGPHRLMIERARVRVIPPLSAYRNAHEHLALPAPTKGRSLRVPVDGEEPDWATFAVVDGEGHCLVVEGNVDDDLLGSLVIGIGAQSATETPIESDHGVRIALREMSEAGPARANHHWFPTLHQLIDGAEWTEDVLNLLSSSRSPTTFVRIGPVNRIERYEHAEDLKRGISVVAALLQRVGLLVVVYGRSALKAIRGGFVSELWQVSELDAPAASMPPRSDDTIAKRVRVERQYPLPVSFIAKLG